MATENGNEQDNRSEFYFGRFTDGKWYCDCNRRASCRPVTNGGPNKGRKFWKCAREKDDPEQCPFFVWMEDEEKAKAWLAKNGKTPTKNTSEAGPQTPTNRPIQLSNPFTKSIRKRPLPQEVPNDQENLLVGSQSTDGGDAHSPHSEASPSRKTSKASHFSTPGRANNESTPEASLQMPTPRTGENAAALGSPWFREDSPTPNQRRLSQRDRTPELTNKIIGLIRSDKVVLKETTKMKIRHEINKEFQLNKATVESYEKTIADLYAKVDELERTAGFLTAGGAVNDAVDLSD